MGIYGINSRNWNGIDPITCIVGRMSICVIDVINYQSGLSWGDWLIVADIVKCSDFWSDEDTSGGREGDLGLSVLNLRGL